MSAGARINAKHHHPAGMANSRKQVVLQLLRDYLSSKSWKSPGDPELFLSPRGVSGTSFASLRGNCVRMTP